MGVLRLEVASGVHRGDVSEALRTYCCKDEWDIIKHFILHHKRTKWLTKYQIKSYKSQIKSYTFPASPPTT